MFQGRAEGCGTREGVVMIRSIRKHLRRDEGASAVEYGLLVAGIAAVIIAVVFVLGTKVHDGFQKTCGAMTGTNGTACP